MLKIFSGILFLPIFCLLSCRQHQPAEKEDVAYWNSKVVNPSHELLYKTENPQAAIALFDSLRNATEQSSPYIEAAPYVLLSNYHLFFSKNKDSTAAYVDSAIHVYRSKNVEQHYPRAYVGLLLFGGEMAFRLGNYMKSNDYFFLAKQLADKHLDPCERSAFTYNAAMVSYRQQNFDKSAAYFKEAYANQATCPVQTTAIVLQQQEIQSNIGLCLVKLKKYDSALQYFHNALQIAERYKDSLGPVSMDRIKGVVYGNMAKVYAATNRPAKAETYFLRSIALNARPGYELNDALANQVQLAELYGSQKRLPEMKAALADIQAGLDTLHDNNAKMGWLRLMAKYHQEMDQPLEEMAYFKTYVALRDSTTEVQKQLVQADISRQLKDKEQALRIADLTKDNQLGQIYLWVAIAFSIMAAIIIFLVLKLYRRSNKNIRDLKQLNSQISQQKNALEKVNKEKDRILHVVAHDLRNPIGLTAYVSDLILMEERSEKDKASIQMIKDASQQALTLTNELLGFTQENEEKLHHSNEKSQEIYTGKTTQETLIALEAAFEHMKSR
ncbi:MAG: tetratricopeptide repeat protein [Chitinophagaceae bacterium]|nr:MAG: tetratricopeptide repeat protein [Chitinophagaceae bacterium]